MGHGCGPAAIKHHACCMLMSDDADVLVACWAMLRQAWRQGCIIIAIDAN